MSTLKVEVMIVGAAYRIRRHTRMSTASLVARAMSCEASTRAGLQQAFGDQVIDPVSRSLLGSLAGAPLHNANLRAALQEIAGADGRPGNRILYTIVLTADTTRTRAHISAAGAASPTGEAVVKIVPAACATLADADITAAGGINSTREIHSVGIGASHAQFILALRTLCHWILITLPICTAFTARRNAGIATACAELVALEVYAIVIGAALRVHGYALSATALVIVRAREVMAIVGADVKRQPTILV